MSVKTERITILGTPAFKAFLTREAKKAGVSVSQLVRDRCENKPDSADEEILTQLVAEARRSVHKAGESLTEGLKDMKHTLEELRAR